MERGSVLLTALGIVLLALSLCLALLACAKLVEQLTQLVEAARGV